MNDNLIRQLQEATLLPANEKDKAEFQKEIQTISWKTGITGIEPDFVKFEGYPIDQGVKIPCWVVMDDANGVIEQTKTKEAAIETANSLNTTNGTIEEPVFQVLPAYTLLYRDDPIYNSLMAKGLSGLEGWMADE